MKWTKGRHKTGYLKLKLFESTIFSCDCYLIKYPKNSGIPVHIDKVDEGWEHHRINIVLKKAKGGLFRLKGVPILKRIIRFRPDLESHGVSRVKKGTRYVLSFGWLRRSA